MSVKDKLLRQIRGHGHGWAFTPADFTAHGSRAAIDKALSELCQTGLIRRVLRGVYDYPSYNPLLEGPGPPQLVLVAEALARRFDWHIQPSGPAAQNALGLSTQVPVRDRFYSDGPNRTYHVGGRTIEFRHTTPRDVRLKLRESGIIVRALKDLGPARVNARSIARIRSWLPPDRRRAVRLDCQRVTAWVGHLLDRICAPDAT